MKITLCLSVVLLSALVCVSGSRERVVQVKGDPRLARDADHGARIGGVAPPSFKEGGARVGFRAAPARLPRVFNYKECEEALTTGNCPQCAKADKCLPTPPAPPGPACADCIKGCPMDAIPAITAKCLPASVPNPPN